MINYIAKWYSLFYTYQISHLNSSSTFYFSSDRIQGVLNFTQATYDEQLQ